MVHKSYLLVFLLNIKHFLKEDFNNKIEMGKSLLYSWLRHIKGGQLFQTSWKKPSLSWEMKNEDTINTLLSLYIYLLRKDYNNHLYKNKVSAPQLLLQSEIDVLGASFDEFESSYNNID
ncbi:hypothetical protein [Priestia aryabhattai]|uniref:hypothetical protein n=1 Tax=Priestia aryabhattai TaxID=412384 RepID=UPI003D7E6D4D